jgi:hypothetical protein
MTDQTDHLWTIDGIEEGMARVEEDGGRMITIPRYLLPAGAKEGQILRLMRAPGNARDGVTLTISIDERATADALARSKATIASAMAASKKRDPGGNVAL